MKSANDLKAGDVLYVIHDTDNLKEVVICEVVGTSKIHDDVIVTFNCIVGNPHFDRNCWYLHPHKDLNTVGNHYGALFTVNEDEFLKYIKEHFNE